MAVATKECILAIEEMADQATTVVVHPENRPKRGKPTKRKRDDLQEAEPGSDLVVWTNMVLRSGSKLTQTPTVA